MADGSPASPAAGTYPDGSADALRGWDGHSWTSHVVVSKGTAAGPPRGHHGPAFPTHLWFWICVVGFVAGLVLGYLADQTRQAWLSVIASIGVAAFLLAMVMIAWRVLRLREAISIPTLATWGVVGGIVGIAFSSTLEGLIKNNVLENASTGPLEETGKLIVPVILYFAAGSRFRDPRAGFAIVLAGACVFGLIEGTFYLWPSTEETIYERAAVFAAPEHRDVRRVVFSSDFQVLTGAATTPFVELIHPVLTGFVGAVAWFFAWHRHRLFTGAAIGAWALAAVLHSAIDVIATVWTTNLPVVVAVAVLAGGYYLLYRPNVRQLVPPSAIMANHPAWRPHLTKSRALR